MILQSKASGSVILLAAVVLATVPAWGQEEAGDDEGRRDHRLWFDLQYWYAKPSGLEYHPATEADPLVSVAGQQLNTEFGTERGERYAAGYVLPHDMGSVVGSYLSLAHESFQQVLSPGSYIYGEVLAHPDYPGAADNGLADGFLYDTSTTLRDYYLGYQRRAFRTPKVKGDWTIGWRRVNFRRNQNAVYYSIVSPLPPLLPPTVDCGGTPEETPEGILLNCALSPNPDTAALGSSYSGRGPMLALDVDFDLWRDKLVLETGAALTVLRGRLDADYIGTNSFYQCTGNAFEIVNDPVTGLPTVQGCTTGKILEAPFLELSQIIENPPSPPVQVSDFVSQETLSVGIQTSSESASSNVIDAYLAVRWKVLHWFEAYLGFRSSRYDDVGLDVFPTQTATDPIVGVTQFENTRRSVTYEGIYVGVTFLVF